MKARSPGQSTLQEDLKVIEIALEYYLEHMDAPPIVKIARTTGLSAYTIGTLFPCGVARGACRIAGLPRPRRGACES